MLHEVHNARQTPNDYFRRVFANEAFDLLLYVWHKADRTFYGFQLCYDLSDHAKALTWIEGRGFSHHNIDMGNDSPETNRTPIMTPSSHVDVAMLQALLHAADHNLPDKISDFVQSKLKTYAPKS